MEYAQGGHIRKFASFTVAGEALHHQWLVYPWFGPI